MNIVNLKVLLKRMAQNHSKCMMNMLFDDKVDYSININDMRNLVNTILSVTKNIFPGKVDYSILEDGIEKLINHSEDLFVSNQENTFVLGHSQDKYIFKNGEFGVECDVVTAGKAKAVPLVYDVLLVIFTYTNQLDRQQYFHDLLDFYYDALEEVNSNLFTVLSRTNFQILVIKYVPYVKLGVVLKYCDEIKTGKKTDSLVELAECLVYPNILREDCYKITRNFLGSNEYQLLKYRLIRIEEKQGTMGDYFKLEISIKYKGESQILNFFAKYFPTNSKTLSENARQSFFKEEFFYQTFIPHLIELGFEDITDFAPKCYFIRANDVIILDDLCAQQYATSDMTSPGGYDCALLIMKQLAKIHAGSLLLEENMTKTAGKIIRLGELYQKYLVEILFDPDKGGFLIKSGKRATLDILLDKFPEIPKTFTMPQFKKIVEEKMNKTYEEIKTSQKYRNVINHGDMWWYNVLFKTNRNGQPVACLIVDYQLIRYCPPVLDVLFALYTNTDKETRQKYMSKLLNDYYAELSNIFAKYNADLNGIYSYETFLNCCNDFKLTAICISLLYLQVLLIPNEMRRAIIEDENKSTQFFKGDRTEIYEELIKHDVYRTRIMLIIEDLYDDICGIKFN